MSLHPSDQTPSDQTPSDQTPVRIGVIGAGRIGTSHAGLLSGQVPGARLVTVADARPEAARALGGRLGCAAASPEDLLADPDVDAVVITAASVAHAGLVVAAARAGKAVFCEKPMGMTLAEVDQGIAAAQEAGVPLQVGFNRRFARDFADAHRLVTDGAVGTPQLMRSVTRDPGPWGADPAAVPADTIFTQTLIHDFDLLLWLNPGAEPLTVQTTADALVAPDHRSGGLLDTAVVVIRFDNGAIAVAEASFSAAYGYDVRGEVFGSAGMVTMGDGATSSLVLHDAAGRRATTARSDTELMHGSYVGELAAFAASVRSGSTPSVTGHDARRALGVALAAAESARTGAVVHLDTGAVR